MLCLDARSGAGLSGWTFRGDPPPPQLHPRRRILGNLRCDLISRACHRLRRLRDAGQSPAVCTTLRLPIDQTLAGDSFQSLIQPPPLAKKKKNYRDLNTWQSLITGFIQKRHNGCCRLIKKLRHGIHGRGCLT